MNCSGLTRPRKKIKCHYTQRVTAVRWDRVLVNSQISQETQKYTSGSTPLLNFHFDSLLLSLLHMFRTKHFLRNQSVISFHVCMEKKFTFPCFDAAFFLSQCNILKPYMYMQHICFIFHIVRSNTHEKHKTSVQRSKKLKEHTFICYCNTKCSVELTKKNKFCKLQQKRWLCNHPLILVGDVFLWYSDTRFNCLHCVGFEQWALLSLAKWMSPLSHELLTLFPFKSRWH